MQSIFALQLAVIVQATPAEGITSAMNTSLLLLVIPFLFIILFALFIRVYERVKNSK